MHKIYYQPEGIWVGDIMPYGEDGTFYLYHQRDTRNPGPFGEPFGWSLATTKDFVNYKDFGESLERPLFFKGEGTHHLRLVVDDDIATVFVDDVALNARFCAKKGQGVSLTVTDGTLKCANATIASL